MINDVTKNILEKLEFPYHILAKGKVKINYTKNEDGNDDYHMIISDFNVLDEHKEYIDIEFYKDLIIKDTFKFNNSLGTDNVNKLLMGKIYLNNNKEPIEKFDNFRKLNRITSYEVSPLLHPELNDYYYDCYLIGYRPSRIAKGHYGEIIFVIDRNIRTECDKTKFIEENRHKLIENKFNLSFFDHYRDFTNNSNRNRATYISKYIKKENKDDSFLYDPISVKTRIQTIINDGIIEFCLVKENYTIFREKYKFEFKNHHYSIRDNATTVDYSSFLNSDLSKIYISQAIFNDKITRYDFDWSNTSLSGVFSKLINNLQILPYLLELIDDDKCFNKILNLVLSKSFNINSKILEKLLGFHLIDNRGRIMNTLSGTDVILRDCDFAIFIFLNKIYSKLISKGNTRMIHIFRNKFINHLENVYISGLNEYIIEEYEYKEVIEDEGNVFGTNPNNIPFD